MSRTREWTVGAGMFVGTILACGLAGEGVLALLGRPFKNAAAMDNAIAHFDRDLGWSYIPDHQITVRVGRDRRAVEYAFDHFGARVERPGMQSDPARPTLLMVGGSFTMGHGVLAEDTLAGQLAATHGFPLQPVNLAVQGFGSDQSLLMLRRHLDHFATKAVVFGAICEHVIRNANDDRRLLFPGLRFEGTKPMFELVDGELVQTRWAHRYPAIESRLWGMFKVAAAHYGARPSLDVTRAIVREMDRTTRARGIPLVVVDWRMDDASTLCPRDMFDDLGLHLVRTLDDAPPAWSSWVIAGDFHPDARAHHRVAALVLRELEALDVVPRTLMVSTATDAMAAMPRR